MAARRVVRVQRREHEVAGLRGFHGDVGGFVVADFADHDHVRVLAKKRAQRDREGESGFFAHADLIDAGQLDLRGIFDRAQIARLAR